MRRQGGCFDRPNMAVAVKDLVVDAVWQSADGVTFVKGKTAVPYA